MEYKFKSNYILKNIAESFKDMPNNSSDFINRANETSLVIKEGIISSVFVVDDSVFAVVLKNTEGEVTPSNYQADHGDGWFNGPDRTPVDNITLAELAIPTNISSANIQIERYIGKRCRVTVKNNIAVYAEVELGYPSLTTIPIHVIRKARIALEGKTDDIFSDLGKKYFKDNGYTEEEVEALSDFKYVEDMLGKINTFEGEALWFKDTANKNPNENIIKTNPILLGLNKLGMKTKKCHLPSRLFSGK